MSLEHSPARAEGVAVAPSTNGATEIPGGPDSPGFWHELINEKKAGAFLGVGHRYMQAMRQHGDGPGFVRLSARCVKYRRIDLKTWADSRLRTSTADPGPNGAG